MTNLFKTRYLPNADGTESTTALTNANTVFIHTYLGDDSTGDGTREKPYRSMTKALTKAGTYILFRGLINEIFNTGKTVIGDDINQVIQTPTNCNTGMGYSFTALNNVRSSLSTAYYHNCIWKGGGIQNVYGSIITNSLCDQVTSGSFVQYSGYRQNTILNNYNSYSTNTFVDKNMFNCITVYGYGLNLYTVFHVFPSSCVFKSGSTFTSGKPSFGYNIIQPNLTNDSAINVQLLRDAYINSGLTSSFSKDAFDNETCKIIKEQRSGGSHPNIFNKYAPNLTGKLNAAVTTGAKTSVTINVDDANQWPTTGDLFMPTETAYTANGVTMPIGSFEVWSYTSATIVSPKRITLNGPSYTFKTAHSDLNKDCTRYGDVLDYTLNPDPQNEALWASDTGGYVGCFRPAYACDVETGLSAISNVDENGANSGSGDLLQIVNGELKFNSASSQLWNRMSDTTTINIPNGSNFKGLNAMSQDGSPFGYYIGKKQTLISPTAIAAGNALTVGKWYKVYNDNGNSVSEAVVYNGVQYLPEYTFLCVTGVTTFSTLEPGSGSYVKEILSGVLESIEILPYNDMTTPSAFPKFSAPLMGECKLIFYTAAGAARYGKTAGDPVKFADLDLANMLTDFGTVKNKISYYDTWAISNADSEFYLLTNAGLSATLKGYFTQGIPAIKYLRREINGHFDMPYDY